VIRDVRLSVPAKVLGKLPKQVFGEASPLDHTRWRTRTRRGSQDSWIPRRTAFGPALGLRSIRLNKTYRVDKDHVVEFVDVFDVNPHEY
jgi:hypothetical protein